MSFTLYPRSCTVQVGTVLVPADPSTGFHVSFKIKRGLHVTRTALKPHPNTCDLRIWNLGESNRKAIESSPGSATPVPTVIQAGYVGHRATVFNGQLRGAQSVTEGANIITELSTGDGDRALLQRMNQAFGKGTTARQVMTAIVAALGVGPGNLQKALSLLDAQGVAANLYARGCVFKGPAPDIMTDLCRSAGLDWSIQDGALQVTLLDQPLASEALLLDSDHGLEGSPTVDTRGILSATCAMIPGVVPGLIVSMNAKTLKGNYRIIGVETEGDNFENRWVHNIEAVAL